MYLYLRYISKVSSPTLSIGKDKERLDSLFLSDAENAKCAAFAMNNLQKHGQHMIEFCDVKNSSRKEVAAVMQFSTWEFFLVAQKKKTR